MTPKERVSKLDFSTYEEDWDYCLKQIEDAIIAAVAEEREACAQVATDNSMLDATDDVVQKEIARAIRARGN